MAINTATTNLEGASLVGVTHWRGLDLSHHRCKNADFSGANLTGCNFTGADLTGVKFDGAILDRCNFTDAFIMEGDRAVALPRAQLETARSLSEVILPDKSTTPHVDAPPAPTPIDYEARIKELEAQIARLTVQQTAAKEPESRPVDQETPSASKRGNKG